MTKIQFLMSLHDKLSGLPRDEVEERLAFYSEMIEDRMEEGLAEEEAVAAVGSVEEIAGQIAAEIPMSKIAKDKIKPKRKLKAWEIVLLAVGSPLWLSLLIAVFAVAISGYAVIWSLVASLWAVFAALSACGLYGIIAGITIAITGEVLIGISLFAACLVCFGLAIFLFFGCKAATEGTAKLTKLVAIKIKKGFVPKEEAQ